MVDPYTGLPTNGTEGNIQVHYDGKWRFWEQNDFTVAKTRVTCRELGFIRPFNFHVFKNLTEVVGNVVENQAMKCTGKEERLIDCQHENWKLLNKTEGFALVWVKCGTFLV